ncbi:MAG: S1C family serine protease [Pirellulales bacterium]|nr:S1C family serine protease [Pirellulales bacterium]
MTTHKRRRALARLATLLTLLAGSSGWVLADDSLEELEQAALAAAVDRVAPSVVRIDTVGGRERVGETAVGPGPTTGLIVSEDGFIVSSAFGFAQQPASILVTLPDGARARARLIAADRSRQLVLLKVDGAKRLPVSAPAPLADVRVGAWAIAVGRTYEAARPNVSIGIVSALGRIWGKAVQTDAKISPVNYGGPLVDVAGRVIGILVPMSPSESGEAAGVDWYDSGIGFAVPLEHVLSVLPRLRAGETLEPGVLGVNLVEGSMFSQPAELAAVRPNSPAYKAGLQAGDRIVEIDGTSIERQTQFKRQLLPRYAGDKVRLTIARGEERFDREIELIAKLEPYAHPFLGVLPRRDPAAGDAVAAGVRVRYVFAESAAAKAGIKAGDVLVGLAGKDVTDLASVRLLLQQVEIGQQVEVAVRRGEETLELKVEPVAVSDAVPDDLPPAREPRPAFVGERPATGKFALELPEHANKASVFVPGNYDPAVAYGLLVWLPASAEDAAAEAQFERWQAQAEALDLIVLVPRPGQPAGWAQSDLEFIGHAMERLVADYRIDRARIAVGGAGTGGSVAFVVASAQRPLVRGVIALEAPPAGRMPENEPIHPLAIYSANSKGATNARAIEAGAERLRAARFPVTRRELAKPEGLSDDEHAHLERWLDSLDRF